MRGYAYGTRTRTVACHGTSVVFTAGNMMSDVKGLFVNPEVTVLPYTSYGDLPLVLRYSPPVLYGRNKDEFSTPLQTKFAQ